MYMNAFQQYIAELLDEYDTLLSRQLLAAVNFKLNWNCRTSTVIRCRCAGTAIMLRSRMAATLSSAAKAVSRIMTSFAHSM